MLAWEAHSAPVLVELEPLMFPVENRHLSSQFGLRSDPLRGGLRLHSGIDVPARAGAPVRASADGVVVRAGWAGGYGNMVAIIHTSGFETRYAHLSDIGVAVGAAVRRGDVIGAVGSTGRSTGFHLHFETRVDGRAHDPIGQLDRRFGAIAEVPEIPAKLRWNGYVEREGLPVPQLQ